MATVLTIARACSVPTSHKVLHDFACASGHDTNAVSHQCRGWPQFFHGKFVGTPVRGRRRMIHRHEMGAEGGDWDEAAAGRAAASFTAADDGSYGEAGVSTGRAPRRFMMAHNEAFDLDEGQFEASNTVPLCPYGMRPRHGLPQPNTSHHNATSSEFRAHSVIAPFYGS
jgi:hypothetical protein